MRNNLKSQWLVVRSLSGKNKKQTTKQNKERCFYFWGRKGDRHSQYVRYAINLRFLLGTTIPGRLWSTKREGQNSPWEGVLPTFNHTDSCRAPHGYSRVSGGEKGKRGKSVIEKNVCYEFGPFPLFYELLSFLFMCICYFDCLLGNAYRKGQNSS